MNGYPQPVPGQPHMGMQMPNPNANGNNQHAQPQAGMVPNVARFNPNVPGAAQASAMQQQQAEARNTQHLQHFLHSLQQRHPELAQAYKERRATAAQNEEVGYIYQLVCLPYAPPCYA